MREILFRGKRTDNGEWVEGGICETENYTLIFKVVDYGGSMFESPCGELEEFEVIPETVGQYTVLTDKNGTRIFEGDIVKYRNNLPCKIDYIDSQFVMMWDKFYRDFEQVYDDEIEVIGNIHDNPELLRGGE